MVQNGRCRGRTERKKQALNSEMLQKHKTEKKDKTISSIMNVSA